VTAGSAASPEFSVEVIRPVRVSRIDVRYDYPDGIGLEPHTEEDGGDIFAPAGTKVQLTIATDKPLAHGQVRLADGQTLPLSGQNRLFTADLTVSGRLMPDRVERRRWIEERGRDRIFHSHVERSSARDSHPSSRR
jgi:hypothetical protein